ncbi:MAG: 2TM domain-containing protein [Bacteroidetes bacterium]|nr:2TM domain-containing protein [Bacteroidota bacterium]
MSTFNQPEQILPADKQLWKTARKRTAFKMLLLRYVVINIMLVAIWFFTNRSGYFWPVWCMLGWGLGLCFQYLDAYKGESLFSPHEEFRKLREKNP